MRHIFSLILILLLASAASAQVRYPAVVIPFAGTPSGGCSTAMLALNLSSGILYDCKSGTWNAVGAGAAPDNATYITQTANATLTAEQALGLLASGILKSTTGSGIVSIATAGTDYENALTFSSPLSRTVNTVSIPNATGSVNGYLTSTDWTTFNSKAGSGFNTDITNLFLNASAGLNLKDVSGLYTESINMGSTLSASRTLTLTPGDSNRVLTFAGDATISGTNTGDVSLAGDTYLTLSGQVITAADINLASQVTGNLAVTHLNSGTSASSSTFWRGDGTWVNPVTGYVATSRTISTTSPLTGGGDLSADRTLAIPAATTSVNGYLSSTDWTTFNAKVGTSRSISTSSPLGGGGDLSADRTLTCATCGVTGTGLGQFAATSSSTLAGVISDETGTGLLVFATSPTFTTPILGTPTSGTLTNATGLPISTGVSGLGTGVATFLATPSSANLAAAITDETGTGVAVFGTAPTITTSAQLNGYLNLGTGTAGSTYTLNIAPTSGATAGSTVFIQDATATTGKTTITLKEGPVNGVILQSQQANGNANWNFNGSTLSVGSINNTSNNWQLQTTTGLLLDSAMKIVFSSTTDYFGTADAGVGRNAPGIVEMNNGTLGTLRDIMARTHYGSSSATGTLALVSTSGVGTTDKITLGVGNNGATVMATINTGGVGVNTTTMSGKFNVDGTVYMANLTTSGGFQTDYLCLSSTNEIVADTGTCLVSSLRFKNTITPIDRGLAEVVALRPVNFYYNNDKDPAQQFGFIAEEADLIDPRLVTRDKEGKAYAFRYENYTAVLTKAVQELAATVKELKDKVDKIKP